MNREVEDERDERKRKMQRSHDTNSNNEKSHNIIIYIFVLCTVPIKKIIICVRNKTKFETQSETSQPASQLAHKPCAGYECACGLPEVFADRTQSPGMNATATVLARSSRYAVLCHSKYEYPLSHYISFECPQTIYFR